MVTTIFALAAMMCGAPEGQGRDANQGSVLKQIQDEVSSLVLKSRRALVRIEDSPRIASLYSLQHVAATSILQAARSRLGKSAIVEADPRINALVVFAPEAHLATAFTTIKALDLKPGLPGAPDLAKAQRDAAGALVQREAEENLMALYGAATSMAGKSYLPATGFCVSPGFIVTSAEAVRGLRNPTVVNWEGRRAGSKLMGVDEDLNLGVLRLEEDLDVGALSLGDSFTVKQGHFAIALGASGSRAQGVNLSLVSEVVTQGDYYGGRFLPGAIRVETVASSHAGGAPLLNADGQVIGISFDADRTTTTRNIVPIQFRTTSKTGAIELWKKGGGSAPIAKKDAARKLARSSNAAPAQRVAKPAQLPVVAGSSAPPRFWYADSVGSGSSQTIAVPIDDLKLSIAELCAGRTVKRGWLGVDLDEVEVLNSANAPRDSLEVRVRTVFGGSSAEAAGVREGDVLVELNLQPLRRSADIRKALLQLRADAVVPLRLRRARELHDIQVRLLERPREIVPSRLAMPPVALPLGEVTPPKKGNGR